MRIQNSKLWVRFSFQKSVLGASTMLGVAFLIRYALQPYIEPYAPFHFFIVACLFIAYLYGYKLALVATAISSLLGSYFFVKPYFTFGPASVSDVIQFFNFSFVTFISVVLIERLQRTAYARDMMLKIMNSRHKITLYRENDRIYFSKKNSEAWSILEEILTDFDDIVLLQFAQAPVKLEPLFLKLTESSLDCLDDEKWQLLLHPDDLAILMAYLAEPVPVTGRTTNFTLRFMHQATTTAPLPVQLESYSFMGQPLKILRIVKD
jgi:K+-sensing histidine kinase KdpD